MEPGSMTPLGPHVTKAVSTLLALGLPIHTLDFLLCLLGYLPARVEKTLRVNFQLQGSPLPALRHVHQVSIQEEDAVRQRCIVQSMFGKRRQCL